MHWLRYWTCFQPSKFASLFVSRKIASLTVRLAIFALTALGWRSLTPHMLVSFPPTCDLLRAPSISRPTPFLDGLHSPSILHSPPNSFPRRPPIWLWLATRWPFLLSFYAWPNVMWGQCGCESEKSQGHSWPKWYAAKLGNAEGEAEGV